MLDMTRHRDEDDAPEPLFYVFRQSHFAWFEKLQAEQTADCARIAHKLRSDDLQLERIGFLWPGGLERIPDHDPRAQADTLFLELRLREEA